MRTGREAVQKAIDEANSGGGGFSGKLLYWNWKPDETKYLRFLTDIDDILTVDFYEFVVGPNFDPQKNSPQSFIVAPDLYFDEPNNPKAVDWVLKYGGMIQEYGSKKLVTPEPKRRTVALAVLKEEVPRTDGSKTKIGTQDVLSEFEMTKDDKTIKYPARQFGVVRQAYKNFWVQLVDYAEEFGTLMDRDYKITRRGGGKDTTYSIIPKDPDPDFDPEQHKKDYGYGESRPDDDPDRFLYCPSTLPEWAEYYASEERVKFFLTGESDNAKTNGNNADGGGTGEFHKDTTHNPDSGADEAQAAPPPTDTNMGNLRDRLKRHT